MARARVVAIVGGEVFFEPHVARRKAEASAATLSTRAVRDALLSRAVSDSSRFTSTYTVPGAYSREGYELMKDATPAQRRSLDKAAALLPKLEGNTDAQDASAVVDEVLAEHHAPGLLPERRERSERLLRSLGGMLVDGRGHTPGAGLRDLERDAVLERNLNHLPVRAEVAA